MKRTYRRNALVVGLGRFGSAAAERLMTLGWDVVGIDKDARVVQSMQDRLVHIVQIDAADEEALATLGVSDFEVCIVSRGESIESSILLVLNLQHLQAKQIIAKATSEHHANILRRLGVNSIIFPEIDAGRRLAETLQAPHLTWWNKMDESRALGLVRVPKGRAGCPLDLWKAYHRPTIEVLAHLSDTGHPLIIDRHAPLKENELLLVSGSPEDLLALGQ
ncbi:MAG: TrkA family potassium uptake protein, partial [Armatimonadetes bacterium]|nr:TrkA family potassium uptake protein [Armatimonadota bacterium]